MRKPTTVNLLCVFWYLSHFLPVQWNNYVFKCQWSLTDLSHRELQGINNDSGIVKTSPYKYFHFFFHHYSLMICSCLFLYLFLSSKNQCSPKQLSSCVGCSSWPQQGGRGGKVSATGNLRLLWCYLFRHLLGGLSNPSAARQCFSKCESTPESPEVWSWAELVCGDVLYQLIPNSFSETERNLSLK